MKIDLHDVTEQDMDMLIIEEFICNESFRYLFYDQDNVKLKHDFVVSEVYRSLSDEDGESDVTFILSDEKTKVAILIEDKIDAPTMERQSERYVTRAKKGIASGKYDEYYIFLVCPEKYWEEHKEDENANYENRVFYEEIQRLYSERNDVRNIYKYHVIQTAIEAKKKGYQVVENTAITQFWKDLRPYCEAHDSQLILLGNNSVKGSGSYWMEFPTSLKKVKIAYKSNKGYLDLQIGDYGDKIGTLTSILRNKNIKLDKDMRIYKAHKSAAIRIHKREWEISFEKQPFDTVSHIIDDVLWTAVRLNQLADELNETDLY